MRRSILSIAVFGLVPFVGFCGVRADAAKVAKEQGVGIEDMRGVPGEFKPGAFGFKVSLRNEKEEPLRGHVELRVAASDEENPDFLALASAEVDLTLPSANPAPGVYELKGEIATNLVWRDVRVVADVRGKEIVLSDGFVAGTGRRPERLRKREQATRRFVRGADTTRAGAEIAAGEDFYPDGFRVAVVGGRDQGSGIGDQVLESAERAGWEVEETYPATAEGWRGLAADLADYDAVLSLVGFPEEVDAAPFTNFVAKGGVLWLNGVGAKEEIFGLAAFASAELVPDVKVRTFSDAEIENHLVRDGSRDSWELQYPEWGNLVEYTPNTVFALSSAQAGAWAPIARVATGEKPPPVLLRRSFGKGLVYVGTTPSVDAQFYANLRFHAGLQTKKGLVYRHRSAMLKRDCFPEQRGFRDPTEASVAFGNIWPEPCDFRVTLKAEDEGGVSRTVWRTFADRRVDQRPNETGMGLTMDSYGLYGKTHYTMTVECPQRDYRTTYDLGTAARAPYLDIRAPFYRGWVSEKRQKPSVTIGVTVYDDRAVGKEVTLETFDTKGRRLAFQRGWVRQYRRENDRSVWFEVPVAKDAPCGEYRLVARCERDEGPVVSVSKFEIRAVEPGQVMYDQDGTLMNEGRRFHAYGTFHLALMDDPIGPWNFDTNTNTEVRSPECLKEDGTPFTLFDVGFNYCQCWQEEWEWNFTSDPEKLKTLDPIGCAWSYWGREKIYKPLVNVNHRILREQCRKMIEAEPDFYEKLAAKNRARAKKCHDLGLLLSIEMGLPAYKQMLESWRYKKPWDKELPYRRNDFADVRAIVRDMLKDDVEHTVGGWYVLDESNSGQEIYDQDNVVREEDDLHPIMLLGEVAALHGPVDIGIDQMWCDSNPVLDMHLLNGVFGWGLRFRGGVAPHGGAIICCHRVADEKNAPDQSLDTLFTQELSVIMTGVNGSMMYTWRENRRPQNPYGAGWCLERPRELREMVRRLKVLEPYFLNGLGTMAKSSDGLVRARVCGDEAVAGRAVLFANFERREKRTQKFHIPELAGLTLEPLFEEGTTPVKVDAKGDFTLEFKPDVSRVLRVK